MIAISTGATGSQPAWPVFEDPTLLQRILDVIAIEGMIDRTALVPDATLETLGVDSIEVVMIVNGLEDAFEATIPNSLQLGNTNNLAELVGMLGAVVAEHTKRKA